MTFLLVSFLAGVLTVLAPCILPLLPVVVGSSARGHSKLTPYIAIVSLGVSIILFTFVLKVSTAFIAIPQLVWTSLSGGILVLFGITLLFPALWEQIPGVRKLSVGSNKTLGKGYTKKSFLGDVLIGASLGPVFSTCSPTYFVILATVLPASYLLGSLYLLAYVVGLSLVLLLIALLGEKLTARMSGLSDSRGYFKRILGLLFMLIGLAIFTGFDKRIETAVLESGYFDVTTLEYKLLDSLENQSQTLEVQKEIPQIIPLEETVPVADEVYTDTPITPSLAIAIEQSTSLSNRYVEFVNPSGFVNTNGKTIKMSDYIGKDVVLVELMTYSCINCQRTFPYMNSWHEKYKDEGLTVIGVHTPEFAFEKKIENVETAMKEFGIMFPVVLDNNYETWNAYDNRFWPRRYLVDIEGNIVFDHIGEGKYTETELQILELLKQRNEVSGIE